MIKKSLLILAIASFFATAQTGWQYVSTLPGSPNVTSIAVVDANVIFVACEGGKVFRSINGGVSWADKSTGLPAVNCYGISAIDSLNCWVGSGSTVGAIYRTTNGGTSWTLQVSISGSFINGIKMFNSNYGIFIADPTAASGQVYQFRYTTNGGTNWLLSPTAPSAASEYGVINAWDWLDTSTIWAGSANYTASPTTAKIFKTTNGINGTWSFVPVTGTGTTSGLYWQAIGMVNASNGMAASNNSNVVKTTNGGASWTVVANPVGLLSFAAINMNAIKSGSNEIRMSTSDGTVSAVYKTTNFGTTWTSEPLPTQVGANLVQHMQFVSGNLGFAGCEMGVFLKYIGVVPVELTSFTASAQAGKVNLIWKTATETNNRGFEIERKVNDGEWTLLAFKNGNGTSLSQNVYSYSDNVSSLSAKSISYRLKQIDFNGNYEYSNIAEVANVIPVKYSLDQNFPNPFNPTTSISYRIPEAGFVTLKVYNSLGQEMTSLVNEVKEAGTYDVQLNASSFSSGIYYYVLKVNDVTFTKKMTLLK